MHPNHFAEAIESIAGIRAYQVTQQAHGIDITVVCSGDDPTAITHSIETGVGRRLTTLGIVSMSLNVTTAVAIVRPDVASGKFKLVRARVCGDAVMTHRETCRDELRGQGLTG